jgi:hypothetical protein
MSGAGLTVTIGEQSELRFGHDNSWFSILIVNDSDNGASPAFRLTLPPEFVTKVNDIEFSLPDEQDTVPTEIDEGAAQTTWKIGGRGIPVAANSQKKLKLSKIKAANKGTFQIPVKWFDAGKEGGTTLPVTVLEGDDWPKIKSFTADEDVFLPRLGAMIALRWETDADVVTLKRNAEQVLPKPGSGDKTAGNKGRWEDPLTDRLSGIRPYRIEAAKGERTISETLFVRIQDPGWNRIPDCSEGSPALVLNDGNERLFGIFVSGGNAFLYRLNPNQGTLGREDQFLKKVPEGMEKSPGAFLNQKIWLAGGSQIDSNLCSRKVWWFDPKSKESGEFEAGWSARMGHACVAFGGEIWIIGGVDEMGNTLDEVWHSSDGIKWSPGARLAAPLCMAAATAFDSKLWVYGGAANVLGIPKKNLWYLGSASDSSWNQMSFWGKVPDQAVPELPFGDPFASALCAGKHRGLDVLCGLGTFQTATAGIKSGKFTLSGISYGPNTADLSEDDPIPTSKLWPTTRGADQQQPFRLSAVGFNAFIFVVSLVYGSDNRSLSYLVQDTSLKEARK